MMAQKTGSTWLFGTLLVVLYGVFHPGMSWAAEDCGRKQLAARVVEAQQRFEQDCGFGIMQNTQSGDVDCNHGKESLGSAWNRALIAAGLPEALDEREALAQRLDLDSAAGLALMGMARPQAIEYLLKQLRTCEDSAAP